MMMWQVYEAEKVVTRTRVYHRSCLACSVCSRGLEAATATEAGDGRVYCRTCCRSLATRETHNTNTATDSIKAEGDMAGCPACGGKVMEGS